MKQVSFSWKFGLCFVAFVTLISLLSIGLLSTEARTESPGEETFVSERSSRSAITSDSLPALVAGVKAHRGSRNRTGQAPVALQKRVGASARDRLWAKGVDGVPSLPPPLVYWPRPFGMTGDNIKTPSGAFQQSLYGQENAKRDIFGSTIASPGRWVFPKSHTDAWLPHWEAKMRRVKGITPEMLDAIGVMAGAFVAYDADVNGTRTVPCYATICGNQDFSVLPGHLGSLRAVGRFILILNTVIPEHVALTRALEDAFPQRFVAEYSMLMTRQLKTEQDEYMRRHGGSTGIMKGSDFVSAEESASRFKSEDDADDALDLEQGAVSTAYYRWYLRNLHPDLLTVPLSSFHSVAMGWNRILNLCFRGPVPLDYVFIANGDFYLLKNDLSIFADYTRDVINNGPFDRVSLGGYQDSLSYAFFAYTFNAWQRFGEFDETLFPMYHEDNEFHARILSGDMDMFQAYDKKFSQHNFKHVGSMSRSGHNPELGRILGNQAHPEYIREKYNPVERGLTMHPLFKHPFNNGDIDHRNAWAIDVTYRKCLIDSFGCRVNTHTVQRLLRGEDQTQPGTNSRAQRVLGES